VSLYVILCVSVSGADTGDDCGVGVCDGVGDVCVRCAKSSAVKVGMIIVVICPGKLGPD